VKTSEDCSVCSNNEVMNTYTCIIFAHDALSEKYSSGTLIVKRLER
jgi:hypothetical protein